MLVLRFFSGTGVLYSVSATKHGEMPPFSCATGGSSAGFPLGKRYSLESTLLSTAQLEKDSLMRRSVFLLFLSPGMYPLYVALLAHHYFFSACFSSVA